MDGCYGGPRDEFKSIFFHGRLEVVKFVVYIDGLKNVIFL